MPKLHTRIIRHWIRMGGLTGRHRKARPKTFKTEAAARKWAEANGIKNYTLRDTKAAKKHEHKFRIIESK